MRILIIYVTLFLTACSAAPDSPFVTSISPWRGKTIQSLEQVWGAPDLVTTDDYGRHHYTFITKKRITVENNKPDSVLATPAGTLSTPNLANPNAETTTLVKCTTVVDVDQANIIQTVAAEGDLCNNDEFMQKMRAPN